MGVGGWLSVQCACGVCVMYCVSVHVFVHAWGKQTNNKKVKCRQSVNRKKDDSLLMDLNPLPSACDSTVQGVAVSRHAAAM